jgi:hypothetical protein
MYMVVCLLPIPILMYGNPVEIYDKTLEYLALTVSVSG